jgi:hypothetical protein
MYQRINFWQFCDAFRTHDRAEQFSYDAKRALFDYLEQLEEDTGAPIELDVIGLCCDYAESTADELIEEFGLDVSGCDDNQDRCAMAQELLEEHTTIVWQRGDRFLYQQF